MRSPLLVFIPLLLSSIAYSAVVGKGTQLAIPSNALFADKPQAHLYWEALIYMAHNDPKTAREIVTAIKNNEPLSIADLAPLNQTDLDDFFDQLFIIDISRSPEFLTYARLFEPIGIREHNAYLGDSSIKSRLEECAERKECLAQLRTFANASRSGDQQLSYQIIEWTLEHEVKGDPYLFHGYVINQMFGVIFKLNTLFTQFHPLELPEDVDSYISRLGKVSKKMAQIMEILELQKSKGIIPPQFTLQKVTTIIKKMTPDTVTDHIFYTRLAKGIETLEVPNKASVLAQAATIIKEQIYPAYHQLLAFINELLATDVPNNGVWALPDGDNYYNYLLQAHTTTNLTAEEIHQLGLQEVDQIEQQMRAIFAQEGIVNDSKSIGELMQDLSKDPSFYYPNTEEGRAQCLADYKAIIERSRVELGPLFDLKPEVGVEVKPIPVHEQEGQPGAYYFRPSHDGVRPGIFFVNLRNMNEAPKYGMETLAIHEAEPGHHFQLALQIKMDMPMIRKISGYTAYAEGWALYTEKLAYEHNFYSSSFSKLGHLRDEMMRAVRLVVDTGIHYKRWTREQAIDYFQKYTGFHYDSTVTEIERYFVMPGQACAYKIGQLKILELRKRAKDALGNAFDIREFHNAVLRVGGVPLTILEQVIDQYIAQKLK